MKRRLDYAAPLRHAVGLMFLLIILVTCLQVFCRYVLNDSLVWSEELVRFTVIWMCFFGAAVSCYDDSNMMLNTIVEKLPVKAQFAVYLIRQLLIMVFCLICSYRGIAVVRAAWYTRSAALHIPNGIWRLAGVVGLVLMAIFTLLRVIADFRRFRNGEFSLKDGG